MRKRMIILTLAAAALVTGLLTWQADAQTWRRGLDPASLNYSPIVEKAACYGWGPHCPPGRTWRCGPYGYRCWCARCW
jgi:hypothetical protein